MRYRPSAEQVRRHVAYCKAHGIDVIDSCTERWGWPPAILIRMAPRPRRQGPHSLWPPATA
ncbi:hypothetical protein D9Y22_12355 [Methylorubrum sp. DB1722]|nr:hypothetical protein [Methylorubrum sp. DB1722]